MFCKNGALIISQNASENTCIGFLFSVKLKDRDLPLYQKKTSAQMFFCDFWTTFKNIYFMVKHLQTAASGRSYFCENIYHKKILVNVCLAKKYLPWYLLTE